VVAFDATQQLINTAAFSAAHRLAIGDPMEPLPARPVRSASSALRRLVDDAVGAGYDAPFMRLDLLLAGRESRCGCDDCRALVGRVVTEIVASLPRR
jgi:hypothetical protein